MSTPAAPKFDGTQPCARYDTEIFFPASEAGAGIPIAVCTGCPFREPCLSYALKYRIVFGVWGGKTEDERKLMLRHLRNVA